jgi:hypothetical protein
MTRARWIACAAFVLFAGVARAENPVPLIDRPLTIPRGTFSATLELPYTNWASSAVGTPSRSNSATGESLALGADYGVSDQLQLGLATAFPINPGAGFGSVLASAAAGLGKSAALRFDAGYEQIGVNGANSQFPGSHVNRYFGGLGAPIKIAISPTLAFVSGRAGAVQFAQFRNIGDSGSGFYFGGTWLSETAADVLTVSSGNHDSGTIVGINLPAGLLVQPDPHFALTLRAGYSAVVFMPSGPGPRSTITDHFVPIGIEGVLSPISHFDVGASLSFDGLFAQSGGGPVDLPGYFDLRAAQFWIRFHGGP